MPGMNMDMRVTILFIMMCLLPTYAGARGRTGKETPVSGSMCPDSVYNPCIRDSAVRLSCHFSYPPGGWRIQERYGDNARELDRLDGFIRSSLTDTLVYVRRILLTGYCSVEGSYIRNEELASERTRGVLNYLNFRYSLAARYPVETRHVGEDWDKLRELVVASGLPGREEVLEIIDHTDIFRGREKKLMDLDGGVPYRTMLKEFFPLLRRVEISVEYDVLPQKRDSMGVDGAFPAETVIEHDMEPPCRTPAGRIKKERSIPLLSLKTDLVSWAGLTPELEHTVFMPNLSVELFLAHRWSLNLTGMYADRDYDGGDRHWGVSAYSLEPRFWFGGDESRHWFYTGIYGQAGDFDNRSTDADRLAEGTANCTGAYLQCGLSLGCYLPLGAHWGIEVGIRGGYRLADVTSYDRVPPYRYLNRRFTSARFGLTAAGISLCYRFGKRRARTGMRGVGNAGRTNNTNINIYM